MSIENSYKEIIGGTQEEAEAKFPWLKDASFEEAVIDISDTHIVWDRNAGEFGGEYVEEYYLTWKDGVWEDGVWEGEVWENGVWKNGFWEGGTWEGGRWKRGTWKGGIWENGFWEGGVWREGSMWSNIDQKYIEIKEYKDGKFIKNE